MSNPYNSQNIGISITDTDPIQSQDTMTTDRISPRERYLPTPRRRGGWRRKLLKRPPSEACGRLPTANTDCSSSSSSSSPIDSTVSPNHRIEKNNKKNIPSCENVKPGTTVVHRPPQPVTAPTVIAGGKRRDHDYRASRVGTGNGFFDDIEYYEYRVPTTTNHTYNPYRADDCRFSDGHNRAEGDKWNPSVLSVEHQDEYKNCLEDDLWKPSARNEGHQDAIRASPLRDRSMLCRNSSIDLPNPGTELPANARSFANESPSPLTGRYRLKPNEVTTSNDSVPSTLAFLHQQQRSCAQQKPQGLHLQSDNDGLDNLSLVYVGSEEYYREHSNETVLPNIHPSILKHGDSTPMTSIANPTRRNVMFSSSNESENLHTTVNNVSVPPLPPSATNREEEGPGLPRQYIELYSGHVVELYGAQATWESIVNDSYAPCYCLGCSVTIYCTRDATYALCPRCSTITAVDDHISHGDNIDRCVAPDCESDTIDLGGVGLGFTFEELISFQELIAAERTGKQSA